MNSSTVLKFPYQDLPEIAEVFADGLERMSFNGEFAHLTLTCDRITDLKPSHEPTGVKVTAARLVLSPSLLIKLHSQLNHIMAALERPGVADREGSE